MKPPSGRGHTYWTRCHSSLQNTSAALRGFSPSSAMFKAKRVQITHSAVLKSPSGMTRWACWMSLALAAEMNARISMWSGEPW